MKLLIINGPNINMLGIREKNIYGQESYKALVEKINKYCEQNDIDVKIFQSNHEGDIVDEIQKAYQNFDGIVINPAAYTHTSIAILDALKAVQIPAVEVHISNVYEREEFRHISYVRIGCVKSFVGLGLEGYIEGIKYLQQHISENNI